MKPAEIKEILDLAGIAPTKYRGQNFLCSDIVIQKIVDAAEITPGDHVLEIGPGLGVLTRALVYAKAKLLAVELDRNFVPILTANSYIAKNTDILEGDILKFKNNELVERLGGVPYKLVANIPYNITGAIIQKFLEEEPRPECLILMVQAEVAERLITDKPMSMAGALTRYLARIERVMKVSSQAFWPAPKVDSAVIKITPHSAEVLASQPPTEKVFPIIKTGFGNRRKQLANNLSDIFGSRDKAAAALVRVGLKAEDRAETLTISDWINLSRMVE